MFSLNLTNVGRVSLLFAFVGLLVLGSVQDAHADEIAIWNFNDSDLSVDHGSGTLSTNFNLANVLFTFGGTSVNARLGDVPGQSMTLQGGTGTSNNGRNITLNVGTIGFGNVVITFASQGTASGFTSNQLQYSIDGVTFLDFGSPYTPPAAFGLFTFDLSSIVALNDNPNAAFRIVFNGATTATGNNRLDNLVVEGRNLVSSVPEPSSLILLGLGLGGVLTRRVRRLKGRRKGWLQPLD